MEENLKLLLKLNEFSQKLLCGLQQSCSKTCKPVPGKLKLRLEVNDVKYKLLIDLQENVNVVNFDDLRRAISNSYQRFLPFLDEKRYAFEIFDNDFNEFIVLDESDFIQENSKLRVRRINSPETDTTEAEQSKQLQTNTTNVHEDSNGIVGESYESTASLSSKPSVETNTSQIPLLSTTRKESSQTDETSLSQFDTSPSNEPNILPHTEQVDKSSLEACGDLMVETSYANLEEVYSSNFSENKTTNSVNSFSSSKEELHEINTSFSQPNGPQICIQVEPKLRSESLSRIASPPLFAEQNYQKHIGKQLIPVSNFIVKNFSKKRALASAVRKHTKLFVKHSQHASIVWVKVSQTLAASEISFTPDECRGFFSGLMGQYICILKNLMEFTVDEAQLIWPLFKMFHYSFNLKPFKADIFALRELFNNYSKEKETNELYRSRSLDIGLNPTFSERFTERGTEYMSSDWQARGEKLSMGDKDWPPLSADYSTLDTWVDNDPYKLW